MVTHEERVSRVIDVFDWIESQLKLEGNALFYIIEDLAKQYLKDFDVRDGRLTRPFLEAYNKVEPKIIEIVTEYVMLEWAFTKQTAKTYAISGLNIAKKRGTFDIKIKELQKLENEELCELCDHDKTEHVLLANLGAIYFCKGCNKTCEFNEDAKKLT